MDSTSIILIVDDEATNRAVITARLRNHPFDLLEAKGGEEALAILESVSDIDLVLLDIMMPKISGYEVLAAIRNNPTIAGVKVIMLSALSEIEDKVKAFELGADDYIAKPPNTQELLARIKTQLRIKFKEDLVQAREAQLRRTIASINDQIFSLNLNGICTEFHPSADQNYHSTHPMLDDFLGKSYTQNFPPEVTKQYETTIQTVLQTENAVEIDYDINIKGQTQWYNAVVTVRKNLRGETDGVTVVVRNITPRKQAEIEYQKLVSAVESSADVIYITNLDNVITNINAAFTHITGWSAADALGKTPKILKSGLNAAELYEKMWDKLANGARWQGLLQNKRRLTKVDHNISPYYWAESTISPIFHNGEKIGYVAVQRDVSERIARNEARELAREAATLKAEISQILQQPEPLQHRLQNALNTFISIKDLNLQNKGGIFIRPPTTETLEPFVTHGTVALPKCLQTPYVPFGKCLCGLAARDQQIIISDNCWGDDRHEYLTPQDPAHGHYIIPLMHKNKTLGVIYLYTDVNPSRNQARIDALQQIAALISLAIIDDHISREREQLRKAAEETAQAKTNFLATMSHEIRTPLNAILGLAGLMLNTTLDQNQQQYMNTIHQSGNNLLGIINDILDFSKIEAGKLELELHTFNLKYALESAIDIVTLVANQKNLAINFEYPTAIPTNFKGDSIRLQQVVVNLLNNAVKFTNTGAITLTVTATIQQNQAYMLLISVQDTGIGIPPHKINRLFQSFSQLDTSTSRKFGGSGLGLAICKRLVEMMGGEIWVESEEGVGSTFSFTVPLTYAPNAETNVRQSVSANEYDPDLAKKYPLQLLLAEDHVINQTVALGILGALGYRADVAGNGLEAVDSLHRQTYDVILMDMQMPEMDGLQATRHIRQTFAQEKQPYIIALTANALPGDRERCLAAGMNDYLSKPIQPDVLVKALKTAAQCILSGNFAITVTATPPPQHKPPAIVVDSSTPAQPKENPVYNPNILAEFATVIGHGSETMIVTVIQSFLEDTPTMLAEMESSLAKGNLDDVKRIAHTLKGGASAVGAMNFAEQCYDLQKKAEAGNIQDAQPIFLNIQAIYPTTEQALLAAQKTYQLI